MNTKKEVKMEDTMTEQQKYENTMRRCIIGVHEAKLSMKKNIKIEKDNISLTYKSLEDLAELKEIIEDLMRIHNGYFEDTYEGLKLGEEPIVNKGGIK
jgi:hypothetical protein